MEEETGMRDPAVTEGSAETGSPGDPDTAERRKGPGWRGWVLSILVAIVLSVTATLLLGGSLQPIRATAGGAAGVGCGAGSGCCPPGEPAK
ncbi:MAG: hypothetical protein OHK0028_10310 [Deltaproteobacteria bacterium]